jgi:Reverse transcriptase (RNA-dependent DNA polymerase)
LWLQAIIGELKLLTEAETWYMVDHPARARVFLLKLVLKRKRDSGGIADRYKARLVPLGHLQRPDIDFFETYAPVVDFTAVRVALAIACNQNMEIHYLDVKCGFLKGKINEEICMCRPDQFDDKIGKVCLLKHSIYGLKQAPRAWNEKLAQDLKSIGYKEFEHTESMYGKPFTMGLRFTFTSMLMTFSLWFHRRAMSRNTTPSYYSAY